MKKEFTKGKGGFGTFTASKGGKKSQGTREIDKVSPDYRVTHKAHVIHCSWESYRLKDTLKKK